MSASLGCCSSTPSFADSLRPMYYMGTEFHGRHMNYNRGFGDNLMRHDFHQKNLVFGVRLTDHVGIEAGHEFSRIPDNTVDLITGDRCAGAYIPEIMSPATFRSKAKIKSFYIGAIGHFPIFIDENFEFIISHSISLNKMTFTRQTIKLSDMPIFLKMSREFKVKKWTSRLMMGLQYNFFDSTSIRATVGWMNSGRFVVPLNDGMPNLSNSSIKTNDSFFYGVGYLWSF